MKKNNGISNLGFGFVIFLIVMSLATQAQETWVDNKNNYTLKLDNVGGFQFLSPNSNFQGRYMVQNNMLYLQDKVGNNYHYSVSSLTESSMTLVDNLGVSYDYAKITSLTSTPTNPQDYPWNKSQYLNVLAEKDGYQWRERENQLYLEFLAFLIGENPTIAESELIRKDFVNEFNHNPILAMTDIKALETSMQQVYSTHNMTEIAMMREIYSAVFAETVQHKPEMNNYAFVKILNKYVTILSVDIQTKLNLSNQDVQAYINYLQFQMMLSGQNHQISAQQRATMQQKISTEFINYPLQQKQTLAFASFIWNNIEHQWLSMNTQEQQNYIAQIQLQLNVQNQNINNQVLTNFWNNNNSDNYTNHSNYNNPAQDFVAASERQFAADRNLYQMMENSMTEQHVTMMNIINADSDYEYRVEYNDY